MKFDLEILYQDQIHDPYFNLALEEYLIGQKKTNKSSLGLLIIYRNSDSIVLGKNQSAWEEANLKFCRLNDVKIAKRVSGGGTVYHDLNNINFSYITSRENSQVSNFSTFNEPIIKYLKSLGLNAEMNERCDILLDGFKISGNAQHLSGNWMISHATLLFDSNLNKISQSLKHGFSDVQTKAIKSKRVKVTNISNYLDKKISTDDFMNGLRDFVKTHFNSQERSLNSNEITEVKNLQSKKYETQDWVYGQSPETQITFNSEESSLVFTIVKGKIESIENKVVSIFPNLDLLNNIFLGQYLNYESLKQAIDLMKNQSEKETLTNILDKLPI